MSVSIRIIGVNQAIRNITRYASSVNTGIRGEIFKGSEDISSDAKRFAPVDLGNLREGIGYTVKDRSKGTLVEGEVISSDPSSAYLEYGTGPHYPPIAAITPWAERKGIDPYALQKSIGENGTKEHPYMLPAYLKNEKKIINGCRKVLRSI